MANTLGFWEIWSIINYMVLLCLLIAILRLVNLILKSSKIIRNERKDMTLFDGEHLTKKEKRGLANKEIIEYSWLFGIVAVFFLAWIVFIFQYDLLTTVLKKIGKFRFATDAGLVLCAFCVGYYLSKKFITMDITFIDFHSEDEKEAYLQKLRVSLLVCLVTSFLVLFFLNFTDKNELHLLKAVCSSFNAGIGIYIAFRYNPKAEKETAKLFDD